jgi:hypothetical protein
MRSWTAIRFSVNTKQQGEQEESNRDNIAAEKSIRQKRSRLPHIRCHFRSRLSINAWKSNCLLVSLPISDITRRTAALERK